MNVDQRISASHPPAFLKAHPQQVPKQVSAANQPPVSLPKPHEGTQHTQLSHSTQRAAQRNVAHVPCSTPNTNSPKNPKDIGFQRYKNPKMGRGNGFHYGHGGFWDNISLGPIDYNLAMPSLLNLAAGFPRVEQWDSPSRKTKEVSYP